MHVLEGMWGGGRMIVQLLIAVAVSEIGRISIQSQEYILSIDHRASIPGGC